MRIISGGQTGVDRAALDVALQLGIDGGGWCPEGRRDESGRIPEKYSVKELPGADFVGRTLQNVIDADATIIFYFGEMRGGTAETLRRCLDRNRPHMAIDALKESVENAATLVRDFMCGRQAEIVNVAGPRQSEWPEGYAYTFRALELALANR